MEVLTYKRINMNGKLVEFTYSECDKELVGNHIWYINNTGYAATNITIGNKRKTLLLHRLIMENPEGKDIDHKNGVRTDNTRPNLRVCVREENARNRKLPSNSKSGICGVSFHSRDKKWVAYITVTQKRKSLGYFENKEDAIKARQEAEEKYFGEFRRNA